MSHANVFAGAGAFSAALGRNLLAGVKAALLCRFAPERVTASWLQITALLLLAGVPTLLAQFIVVGAEGAFSSFGLPGIVFPFAVTVAVAAVACRLLRVDMRVPVLIVVLASAGIFIDCVAHLLVYVPGLLPEEGPIVDFVTDKLSGYWLGTVAAVALLRLAGRPLRGALATAGAAGLVVAIAINEVWRDRTVWQAPYDDTANAERRADYYAAVTEDVLYLQPQLLARRLDRLQPGAGDRDDLYFLGVAGYAGQRVFMRELHAIDKVMRRFASAEHSLLLVNHRDTLRTDPIASTTSLRAALQRIGAVMDRDNDIVFIYLTSHGSREHELSLQFAPLELHDLTPAQLREFLDDAGIQWRVIIVSACYSGGFVEPLADEQTLVITAAAADRTSFGCSDANDFTYFGKAYFDEALARTNSFIEAYALASDIVARREAVEGQTASQPQIAIGTRMRAKLEAFAQGLAAPSTQR